MRKAAGLSRGRLAIAGAAAAAVVVTGTVILLSGGSANGKSAAPSGTNPQARYPVAEQQSPYTTGVTSSLTDDALRAAVPGCGSCKLVTRANGFSPDGAVVALFRTGDAIGTKANFQLVVVSADGKLVWSAPSTMRAQSAGLERFSEDESGYFYLALPEVPTGQMLVVLTWKDGRVVDLGGLTNPKVTGESVVGVLPEPSPVPTATIVSQSQAGVPDASTGGLIESQYQIRGGTPVLIGCRRRVGESGEWIPYKADAQGCAHFPAGPQGPPDEEDQTGQ